jgi:erythronate-4-phosphate dehydrogenase
VISTKTINIVCDENILGLEDLVVDRSDVRFNITKYLGRNITNQQLQECDVLFVRSVTKVNQALLENTPVKFVGSATSGLEHIDQHYLKDNGISFCHAKGANANAVAEYIVSCLAALSLRKQENLFNKTIGIVGHGYVGKSLEKKLIPLTHSIKIYDPYLNDKASVSDSSFTKENTYCIWDEILACDIISFHVPYTEEGKYPTKNLLNKDFFNAISENCILLNAARGEICDEALLIKKLETSQISAVWDVWNAEPNISLELLSLVDIASPHIAGYSLDAKLNATEMLVQHMFEFFKHYQDFANSILPIDSVSDKQSSDQPEAYVTNIKTISSHEDMFSLITNIYNPNHDTDDLRGLKAKMNPDNNPNNNPDNNPDNIAQHFDALRKNYRHRLEWSHYDLSNIRVSNGYNACLKALGFL